MTEKQALEILLAPSPSWTSSLPCRWAHGQKPMTKVEKDGLRIIKAIILGQPSQIFILRKGDIQ